MTAARLPNETPEYRKSRAELLDAEIALKEQLERVAALRRGLPAGPRIEQDYVLREGPADLEADGPIVERRLADLFAPGQHELVLVHFMYGGAQQKPCPMCSMWADGYDAVVRHVRQRAELVLVAEAPVEDFRAWARQRGWRRVRLLSSGGSDLKTDLRMQDADGGQHPGVSVFTRDADGSVRHASTVEALMAPGHWRGVDLLSPVWNLFDLLPSGRGDFMPRLEYED